MLIGLDGIFAYREWVQLIDPDKVRGYHILIAGGLY